jgi:hypothetical protein
MTRRRRTISARGTLVVSRGRALPWGTTAQVLTDMSTAAARSQAGHTGQAQVHPIAANPSQKHIKMGGDGDHTSVGGRREHRATATAVVATTATKTHWCRVPLRLAKGSLDTRRARPHATNCVRSRSCNAATTSRQLGNRQQQRWQQHERGSNTPGASSVLGRNVTIPCCDMEGPCQTQATHHGVTTRTAHTASTDTSAFGLPAIT